MAHYKYTIEEQGMTGAIFGLDITVGDDGLSVIIKQDATWSDLSNQQTSDVAVRVRNSEFSQGMHVHGGATWGGIRGGWGYAGVAAV